MPGGQTTCMQALNLGAGGGGHGRAQLRAGELDLLAAHRRADHQRVGRHDLPEPCSSSCRAINTLEAYSSANQVGVAQLAVQYCQEVVAAPSIVFPGVTFSGSTYSSVTATGANPPG